MKHYIAVIVPQPSGEWRAYFPDFPGCRALGTTTAEAISNSKVEIHRHLDPTQRDLPKARSLEAIHADRDWSTKRAIDWGHAVVSLVGIDPPEQLQDHVVEAPALDQLPQRKAIPDSWWKVEIGARERCTPVVDAFDALFMANGGPRGAALFVLDHIDGRSTLLFTPAAATISRLLIAQRNGVACLEPDRATAFLAGNDRDRDMIPVRLHRQ